MFEEKAAMFLYAVSPVHMGAGTALGVIDSPIQREKHTNHPMIAGSGLKGALRHEASVLWKQDDKLIARVFGPENNAEHAGAAAFSDAQLVLFPVRSLKRSFVYATSPTALGRLKRLLGGAGVETPWKVPELTDSSKCITLHDDVHGGRGSLILETFELSPEKSRRSDLEPIAKWLAAQALPSGESHAFFRQKLEKDLVLLHDDKLTHFVQSSTIVEPHVRISDESGTAEDGGLFYVENLPPESLLVSLCMTSRARDKSGASAKEMLGAITRSPGFDGKMIQIGGDATSGRGQVVLKIVEGGAR